MRKIILEMDILEAVIGLGPNLFYGTSLAAVILIFRQDKPIERKNRVLIIDASEEYQKGRAQNYFEDRHRDNIFSWYQDFKDVKGKAKVVSLTDIADNDWNLNIPRYVEPIIEEETITVEEAINSLKVAMEEAFSAEDKLKHLLIKNDLMKGED